jgi:hypothetical protein
MFAVRSFYRTIRLIPPMIRAVPIHWVVEKGSPRYRTDNRATQM